MNEIKTQMEFTGLERFGHLEDKIFRMVEEFKTIRKDNEIIRNENARLKEQLVELQNNESKVREDLGQYEKEREELRDRVEKALNLLSTLDAQ